MAREGKRIATRFIERAKKLALDEKGGDESRLGR